MGEGSADGPAPVAEQDMCYDRAPGVVYEVTDGEALLVDGQELLRLNAVGGLIWELADGTRTLDNLVDELHSRFPGEPRARLAADASTFLADLVEGGQLVVGRGARG